MKTPRTAKALVAVGLVAGLVAGAMTSASAVTPVRKRLSAADRTDVEKGRPSPDALTRAFESGRLDRAAYALERASSLFHLGSVRNEFGDVDRPDPHAATGLLRDLALHKDELSGADRREANRILARPTDGNADPQGDGYAPGTVTDGACDSLTGGPSMNVCYTWAETTSDAVSPVDSSPNNGTPDYVDSAVTVMNDVWQKEVLDLNFRKPKDDGNNALDIYFVDIGDDGIYGYCTTDEPNARNKKRVSAYCVLDNDYDAGQYNAPPPEVNGLNALKVTLAHEFFHAIQFNYDWKEKLFLMEGTAVWIEDHVYDGINASYAYLLDSALHQPEIPLDGFQGDDDENFEYGAFVFFTFLDEAIGSPQIVRDIWDLAGGTREGIGAVTDAINNEGFPGPSSPYRDFFARWGLANSLYDAFYSEGYDGNCAAVLGSYADVLRCQRPPYDGQYLVGGTTHSSTGWRSLPMDRRSNRFVELFPRFADPANELRVTVNLPDKARGGEATLFLFPNTFFRIKLDGDGDGKRKVPWNGTYSDANLILSNTGRFNNETYKFKAESI